MEKGKFSGGFLLQLQEEVFFDMESFQMESRRDSLIPKFPPREKINERKWRLPSTTAQNGSREISSWALITACFSDATHPGVKLGSCARDSEITPCSGRYDPPKARSKRAAKSSARQALARSVYFGQPPTT